MATKKKGLANRKKLREKKIKASIPKPTNKNFKQILPYYILSIFGAIIFSFGTLFTYNKQKIETKNLDILESRPISIDIPKANTIYIFEVTQLFTDETPTYSELEIEILDKNYNHIYTAYEDLWQESHDNGNGGWSIYSDRTIEFELELQYSGSYYIKTTNYNDNKTLVWVDLYTKKGSLYFMSMMLTFIILVAFLFTYIHQISGFYPIINTLRETKITKTFILAVIIVNFVFISCVVISYTHYGYPHSGDEIRLPTYFFTTKDVHYLG
jgi:hypothetical protein